MRKWVYLLRSLLKPFVSWKRCVSILSLSPSLKTSCSLSDWRVRVGDYRVIYEIDDQARRVNIMRVKHRRDAYR